MGVTPDTADHEKHVTLGQTEMEGVAGTFELARVTYVEGLVHLDRTAAAVRDSANGDPVVRTPSGHTAQRVLSAPPRGQLHVDVPTGRPGREQSATGVSQRQRHHVGSDQLALGNHRGIRAPHRLHPRRFPPRGRAQSSQ